MKRINQSLTIKPGLITIITSKWTGIRDHSPLVFCSCVSPVIRLFPDCLFTFIWLAWIDKRQILISSFVLYICFFFSILLITLMIITCFAFVWLYYAVACLWILWVSGVIRCIRRGSLQLTKGTPDRLQYAKPSYSSFLCCVRVQFLPAQSAQTF